MFSSEEEVTNQVPSPLWGGLGWGVVPRGEYHKEDSSFSEEKEAKRLLFRRSLIDSGHGIDLGSGGEIKVFCFFSSEKKDFFHFGAVLPRGTSHPGPPHKGEGDAG